MQRKPRRFTPSATNVLEERVLLSHVAAPFSPRYAVALPVLTARTYNQSVNRINSAFSNAQSRYNQALRAAVRSTTNIGQEQALIRLNHTGKAIGNHLARALGAAPEGMPYGVRNISPVMRSIGGDVGLALSNMNSWDEARDMGRVFSYFHRGTVDTLEIIVQSDVNSGLYRFKA